MRGGDFGWDYPPGVTGMEPQIAGWPECPKCGDEFDGQGCEGCGFEAYNPDEPEPPWTDLDHYDRARDERHEAELERREG
jgi:hypothetical protein